MLPDHKRQAAVTTACLILLTGSSAEASMHKEKRFFQGSWHNQTGPVRPAEQAALRDEAQGMLTFAFHNYLEHAFPKDELRPISCRGHNSQGGVALTLIDSLSSLLVMNHSAQVTDAIQWIQLHLSFDVDERVHVFELTIRAVGGLLSAHILLERTPAADLHYDGHLLNLARSLADRLLPAFDTRSGIPLSWVNLRKGVSPQETRFTCTACAGTMLLEFGTLARLTGNPVYEQKAMHAMKQLFDLRSPVTGLVGNVLHTDSRDWVHKESGIGAGIDSYYEYLLKAYLLFGDEQYLQMFTLSYLAAMHALPLHLLPEAAAGTPDPPPWLTNAHMDTGKLTQPWISSLSAFWPGLQALSGQVTDATRLLGAWVYAWKQFDALPELFDITATKRHPLQKGYPLRPELMESTYMLYCATHDPNLLQVGRMLQTSLVKGHRQKCGYAALADVNTGELEDSMESFFLSETTKYLFLLHANATDLPDFYIFTTEGHLLPPFPASLRSTRLPHVLKSKHGLSMSAFQHLLGVWRHMTSMLHLLLTCFPLVDLRQPQTQSKCNSDATSASCQAQLPAPQAHTPDMPTKQDKFQHCVNLCADWSSDETEKRIASLHGALPLIPFRPEDSIMLRQRRCAACLHITDSMAKMRAEEAALASAKAEQQCNADADPATVDAGVSLDPSPGSSRSSVVQDRQILCLLKVLDDSKLECEQVQELMMPADLSTLPDHAVVLKQQQVQPLQSNQYIVKVSPPTAQYSAVGATFGQSLLGDGTMCRHDSACHVTGQLVTAEPSNACLPLQSDNQMAGTLVLVERGSCSFVDKATHVQQAGAIGMIVMNNIKDEPSFAMGFDRTAASLHIMAVMVAEDIGHQLSRSLQESDEALFASVQARDEAEQVEAAVPRIVVEHHVYVPDATQSWLQSTYREHGNTAQTWQTAMTELMTSLQHQLHDAFKQSVAP